MSSGGLLSVVIPTRNGWCGVELILRSLESQADLCGGLNVFIVDNNSDVVKPDSLLEFMENSTMIKAFIITETRAGAAFARHTGAQKSMTDWVAFLDDDNIPASDWLISVVNCIKEYSVAGVSGIAGRILCGPGINMPDIYEKWGDYLALRNSTDRYSFGKSLPASAGLVVKRLTWLLVDPATQIFVFKGRDTGKWIGYEDIEAALRLQRLGCHFVFDPRPVIYHHLKLERLSDGNLKKLAFGAGWGRVWLREMRLINLAKPLRVFVLGALFLKDVLLYLKTGVLLYCASRRGIRLGKFYSLAGTVSAFPHWLRGRGPNT